jgi:superfamily II DNA or RNA helicase
LRLIQDLYAASKDNQAFLHARFGIGDDVLKPYKSIIGRCLWLDVFKNQTPSVSKAKQAISDYRKAIGRPEGLAELQVFYCEQAAGFCDDIGMEDEAFLAALVRTIGGGKARPTGKIDIAVMQSLSRQGEMSELVENYGHVIVDECHHLSAVSFEALLKRVKARYVLGLTATPIRRDGQHAIIFMQCGPIRFTTTRPDTAPHDLEVVSQIRSARIELPDDAGIQDVLRHIAGDADRKEAIAKEVEVAFSIGRKILVLTERTDHLEAIAHALAGKVEKFFTLHGRMSKKQRALAIDALNALQTDSARVLLATGKLVGEGFDQRRSTR